MTSTLAIKSSLREDTSKWGLLLLTDIILDYFSELTACAASSGLPSTSVGPRLAANKFTLIQNSWDQSVKLDINPQFKVKLF